MDAVRKDMEVEEGGQRMTRGGDPLKREQLTKEVKEM